jgi:MGT family glycosyltransferase
MARVLFINGPASGHVFPTLGLVEELIAAGEQVVYVSSEEFRDQLELLGAAFVSYENFLNEHDPFATKHFLSLVIKILSAYEVIIPCILELIEQYSFDYIIHDSMYGCGNVVADFLGIPHIATCTSFIHAERLLNTNKRNKAEMMENQLLLKKYISLSIQIRSKFNIQRKLDIKDVFFNEGLLNLVFTSEYFQPEHDKLGTHYKFIGPNVMKRNQSVDFPLERLSQNQKIIYISMGTVFNDVKALYQLCFEALKDFDGQIILSVGNRIDIQTLENIPANFLVVPFVPQLQILKLTDLFITHGGMNSVNEALYYDVPLIVIPMAADQPIVGDQVVALGAGIKLIWSEMTSTILRESVDEILSLDKYRTESFKIGQSLRAAGGQQKAIEEVRLFKEKNNILN